jgi:hypothetical protein
MKNIRDALSSLTPTANWAANDTEVVEWLSPDITQPTQEELDAEVVRLQAEYDSTQYQRDRSAAYAPLGDQMDMMYLDSVSTPRTRTWYDHIEEVKARFPK